MKFTLKIYSIIIIGLFIISGCGSQGGGGSAELGNTSQTTGWQYNTPENGGFEVNTDYDPELGPGLAYIEGGTFAMGRTQDDMLFQWDMAPRRVTVSSFYMDETEVRNVDYREYLYWLERIFSEDVDPQRNVVNRALPDTLVWRSPMAYNEPYVEYYFRHPTFNQYPVVGVNWLQANDYCIWRTDRVNEMILVNEGIIELSTDQKGENHFNTEAFLLGIYKPTYRNAIESLNPNKDTRDLKLEDGLLLPKYRLPTEAEWEFAAFALRGNTVDELVWERRVYPWNGHNVRNDEPRHMGEMMANFHRGRGDMMGVAGALNDAGSITTPVNSFWPNDYGLYCMAGNVNEWVQDVYRPTSHEDVSDFRPFRGNVFKKYVRNEDGSIAARDSLGRLREVPISEEDARSEERRVG